jgi:hypothetical protein
VKTTRVLLGLALLVSSLNAFATAVKIDLSIYEHDLLKAGIKRIEMISPDLNELGAPQSYTIKHVVTTGQAMANRDFVILDIPEIEAIRPAMDSNRVMNNGQQVALTEKQVHSIVAQLKEKKAAIPKWLTDRKQPKYLQIVLAKMQISAVSVKDAKKLTEWAIKHRQLGEIDHPQVKGKTAS